MSAFPTCLRGTENGGCSAWGVAGGRHGKHRDGEVISDKRRTYLEKVGWNGERYFWDNPGELEAPLKRTPLRATVAGTGEHARLSDEKPAQVGSWQKLAASQMPVKRLELEEARSQKDFHRRCYGGVRASHEQLGDHFGGVQEEILHVASVAHVDGITTVSHRWQCPRVMEGPRKMYDELQQSFGGWGGAAPDLVPGGSVHGCRSSG